MPTDRLMMKQKSAAMILFAKGIYPCTQVPLNACCNLESSLEGSMPFRADHVLLSHNDKSFVDSKHI